jgi:ketosteroid isomerase-like protein
MTSTASTPAPTPPERDLEQRDFLKQYWDTVTTGDWEGFAPLVHPDCVVHYPGNHFLSGDHVGRDAIVQLYRNLYEIGIRDGTFVGALHDALTSGDHACALVTYTLELGAGQRLTGEAIGLFHIADGQMVEYWLLERDQKLINDIFKISGRAALQGGGNGAMALGALKHPAAVVRTARRVIRQRRATTTRML